MKEKIFYESENFLEEHDKRDFSGFQDVIKYKIVEMQFLSKKVVFFQKADAKKHFSCRQNLNLLSLVVPRLISFPVYREFPPSLITFLPPELLLEFCLSSIFDI